MRLSGTAVALIALFAAGAALAQPPQPPPPQPAPGERGAEVLDKAGKVASQPARDLGVSKVEIPPLLQAASAEPYGLQGVGSCRQLAAEVRELNDILGPDLDVPKAQGQSRGERLATAGGQAVVNSLIPFRGLVREVTGAAPAQRAMNAALDAGYARRGFLRGVHRARGCKTAF